MLDHIPETPSIKHCKTYVEKWHNTQTYEETDNALHLLFIELFPNNDSMSGVLLKTSALNDFYTTNIFNTYAVAEHICKLRIDDRLRAGDLKLIEEIARVELPGNRMRRFYSFASKYCSHHQPEKYAIYDSYVDEMLRYFRDADKFAEFSNNNLRQYKLFMEAIEQFQDYYHLEGFTLRDIDRYLWQLGKECIHHQQPKGAKRNPDSSSEFSS